MTPRTATAIAALSCFAALPALAAHGPDVRIQGNHKKTQVSGEKGAYHLVEKGSRLTATVKGPTDVTVLLHGTTASAAAGLFLDKKKIHFVDLKGSSGATLSTGGAAGPLKTEQVSIPAGTHEIAVEAFVGGAAVAFRVAHGGGGGGGGVVATGKRHRKGSAALAAAPLAAEPIAPPPAEMPPPDAAPLTPPPPVAAATPPPAPAASPEDSSMMMGEPPVKPPPPEAAPPANPPPEAIIPAPAAATSTTSVTVETDNKEGKRSTATYWLAGTFVVLAGGAVTAWALSSSQNSSYLNASETTPNRGSMLSTANTELTVAEALAGGAVVALAVSAILAW